MVHGGCKLVLKGNHDNHLKQSSEMNNNIVTLNNHEMRFMGQEYDSGCIYFIIFLTGRIGPTKSRVTSFRSIYVNYDLTKLVYNNLVLALWFWIKRVKEHRESSK